MNSIRLRLNGVRNNPEKRFTNKLIKVLAYLEKAWSQEIAGAFLKKIDDRLHQLTGQLFTGNQSEKNKGCKKCIDNPPQPALLQSKR